jgi:hypothetical protein
MIKNILTFLLIFGSVQAQDYHTNLFWQKFTDFNLSFLDYSWNMLQESQTKINQENYLYNAKEFSLIKDSLIEFHHDYVEFIEDNITEGNVMRRAIKVGPYIDQSMRFLSTDIKSLIQICDGTYTGEENASKLYSTVLIKYYAFKSEYSKIIKTYEADFIKTVTSETVTNVRLTGLEFDYTPRGEGNKMALLKEEIRVNSDSNGSLMDIKVSVGIWHECKESNFDYLIYAVANEENSWVSSNDPDLALRVANIQYKLHLVLCHRVDERIMLIQDPCSFTDAQFNDIISKYYEELNVEFQSFQSDLGKEDWNTVIDRWNLQLDVFLN